MVYKHWWWWWWLLLLLLLCSLSHLYFIFLAHFQFLPWMTTCESTLALSVELKMDLTPDQTFFGFIHLHLWEVSGVQLQVQASAPVLPASTSLPPHTGPPGAQWDNLSNTHQKQNLWPACRVFTLVAFQLWTVRTVREPLCRCLCRLSRYYCYCSRLIWPPVCQVVYHSVEIYEWTRTAAKYKAIDTRARLVWILGGWCWYWY